MSSFDARLSVAFAVLGLVVLERLFELWLSRRNQQRVLARGGKEYGRSHYPWMVVIHTGFLVGVAVEWALLRPAVSWSLMGLSIAALGASMALRYWAITTLGDRWSTRVLWEAGRGPVREGPYRWLRHPNYVAVVAEFLFLPLVHGGWRMAVLGSIANAVILAVRLRCENEVLRTRGESSG